MSDGDETLKAAFQALEAERERTWPAAQLAANRAQRRTLRERFDPVRAVRPGDRLHDATLLDLDGQPLTLDTIVADGPAVLLFFRFAACPADGLALPHYDRQLRPALAAWGVPIVAISPQVPAKLRAICEAHALGLTIASDPDNDLARRLGIVFTPDDTPAVPPADWTGATTGTGTWELPMPTVLVVDADRVVRFVAVSPDWLDRPEASVIVAAARAVIAPPAARNAA